MASTTIKMFGTKRFEVELMQVDSGQYCIKTQIYSDEKIQFSEIIKDFKLASFMFDSKVRDLEGH